MNPRFISVLLALSLTLTLGATPARAADQAGSSEPDGLAVSGSVLLSLLHLPFKLATCVGTQAVGAVAYVATYGVGGNYDGGTNGKQIGEITRSACGGSWIIAPDQVMKDYQ